MKFREHRGLLKDSMSTVQIFKSVYELQEFVDSSNIEYEYIGYDKRTGWDTYNVLVDGLVIGQSDSNLF